MAKRDRPLFVKNNLQGQLTYCTYLGPKAVLPQTIIIIKKNHKYCDSHNLLVQ